MRHSVLVLAGIVGVTLAPAARAQCVECAQQMFQATLTSNAWYNINQDTIDQTRSRDAGNGICYDANRHVGRCSDRSNAARPNAVSSAIASQTETAVLAVLDGEYQRRVQAYGSGNASQWLNKAAGDVGRQVGGLSGEYRRRLAASGGAGADTWYIDSARQVAARYVKDGGANSGGALAGGVPPATLKKVEDAAFAVLGPEINRRSKVDGRARAAEWARSLGSAVGAGVRNLAPEYWLRARSDGPASAEAWLVEQSRGLARRQIRGGQ